MCIRDSSADGRLFFKNQQNLAAKLRSTALSLHAETVDRMLREHLEQYFSATLRDCYQVVKVLPPPDEVQIEQDRTTLVIVRPGGQANQLPISADWQAWWEQQQYKNRVLFLSGSRDTFQKVIDAARQVRALQSIEAVSYTHLAMLNRYIRDANIFVDNAAGAVL